MLHLRLSEKFEDRTLKQSLLFLFLKLKFVFENAIPTEKSSSTDTGSDEIFIEFCYLGANLTEPSSLIVSPFNMIFVKTFNQHCIF